MASLTNLTTLEDQLLNVHVFSSLYCWLFYLYQAKPESKRTTVDKLYAGCRVELGGAAVGSSEAARVLKSKFMGRA